MNAHVDFPYVFRPIELPAINPDITYLSNTRAEVYKAEVHAKRHAKHLWKGRRQYLP